MSKPTRRAHITRDIAQDALDALATDLHSPEIDVRQRVDIACRIVDRYYDYLKQLDARKPRGGTARLPKGILQFKSAYTVDITPTAQLTPNNDTHTNTGTGNPIRRVEGDTDAAVAGVGGTVCDNMSGGVVKEGEVLVVNG